MEPYPTVGDIWEWDNMGDPLLLLELDHECYFLCLSLTKGYKIVMDFHEETMPYWRRLG